MRRRALRFFKNFMLALGQQAWCGGWQNPTKYWVATLEKDHAQQALYGGD